MKLSVIIPLYNCERFIGRCLDSVLKQQLDPGDELQIIVIDDGSTDRSGEIADEYASRNPMIQVIHQPNQGVSVARNHGLELVEGDYIHFVDSDDFLLFDNCYQTLLEMIKSASTPIDILRFNMISFFESRKINKEEFYNLNQLSISFEGSGTETCHQLRFIGYACTSLCRFNLINDYELRFIPDVSINEDSLFFLALYRHAKRVVITNANIYGYYVNSGSVSFSDNKKRTTVLIDNLFDSQPQTVAALELFDDPYFMQYRMESHGMEIASRLMKVNLSLSKTKSYIKQGFQLGVFPLSKIHSDRLHKIYDKLLLHPFLFWLVSIPYRYILVLLVKPLIAKNG